MSHSPIGPKPVAFVDRTAELGNIYNRMKDRQSSSLLDRISQVFSRLCEKLQGDKGQPVQGRLNLSQESERQVAIDELVADFSDAWKQDAKVTLQQYKKAVERQFNRRTCTFTESGDTMWAVQRFKDDLDRALGSKLKELTGSLQQSGDSNMPVQTVEDVVEGLIEVDRQNFEDLNGNYLEWQINRSGCLGVKSETQGVGNGVPESFDEEVSEVVDGLMPKPIFVGGRSSVQEETTTVDGEQGEETDDSVSQESETISVPDESDEGVEGEETIVAELPKEMLWTNQS